MIYVPGKGPNNPKIVILGEAPSYEEETALEPFVGPSGRFLDQLLRDAGISRAECWVTNVSKYKVPPQIKGKKVPFHVRAQLVGIDTTKCLEELRVELQQLNPNLVIALGGTALWAMTGKSKMQAHRGSIMLGMGFKVIGTYHPAHILYQEGEVKGYWNKQIMLFDLKRCKAQSQFKEVKLPTRSLQVCRSSGQLYDFLQRYRNYTKPAIDIEAINCIPICVGIAFTRNEGITIPLWNIKGISDIPTADLASIWILLAELLASHDIIGQNFGYDRDKLRRLGLVVRGLASDTMLKAFTINPELPKNLAFNTSIYTEEPYYKDEGMYEGSIDDLLIGCARDSCVTKEIDEVMDGEVDELGLRNYYEQFLLPLHDLYLEIENNGIRFDHEINKNLIKKYIEWDEQIRYNLFKLTGKYINCSSPKQIGDLLFDDWQLPIRKGTGEEDLTALLNSPQVKDPIKKKGIELILEDRKVKNTYNNYLMALPDYDGRMRTSYFICLETGRSSTNNQEPPIRPSVEYIGVGEDGKKVKKKQARGTAFQKITKHGDIGSDVRLAYVPDEGEIFLQADSSQAEARVIFLLAEDYEALELIDKHDYHALTATWFFGGVESDYSKKVLGYESPIRFAGKTLRHACHLGASKRTAAITVNTEARKNKIDFQISEKKAGQAIDIFHMKQPKIKGVFQAQVIKQLEKNRRLVAPVPYGIDSKVGGTRTFYERWGEDLFRQGFSYIPQRTVSENTKGAALRIRARASWIKILVESHDALLVSIKVERKMEAALILREEFQRPISFTACSLPRGELIIPCDVEEGYNYKDFTKFRWT